MEFLLWLFGIALVIVMVIAQCQLFAVRRLLEQLVMKTPIVRLEGSLLLPVPGEDVQAPVPAPKSFGSSSAPPLIAMAVVLMVIIIVIAMAAGGQFR